MILPEVSLTLNPLPGRWLKEKGGRGGFVVSTISGQIVASGRLPRVPEKVPTAMRSLVLSLSSSIRSRATWSGIETKGKGDGGLGYRNQNQHQAAVHRTNRHGFIAPNYPPPPSPPPDNGFPKAYGRVFGAERDDPREHERVGVEDARVEAAGVVLKQANKKWERKGNAAEDESLSGSPS